MDDLLIHPSVLLQETIHYLDPKPGKLYLDVTFGSGGHSRAILRHEPECRVVAVDLDKISLEQYGPLMEQEFGDRFRCLWGNFSNIGNILKKAGIKQVDGVIADFGTSLMQISQRAGFSFRRDTPLDMRMSSSHYRTTAAHIVNGASQEELQHIFWEYGQESHAKKIAFAIVQERRKKPFRTTRDLAVLIEKLIPSKGKKIHPATKVFQALRICVNHEFENINGFLSALYGILSPGARAVCISFHSLEDLAVKSFFHEQEQLLRFKVITKKVVAPTQEEVSANPSSRSARLRAAERL